MKILRALALVAILACSVYAGDMQNESATPPPPPPPVTTNVVIAIVQTLITLR